MLKYFQSHSQFSIIGLLIASLVIKFFWLIHPEGILLSEDERVWAGVATGINFVLGGNAFLITLLAILNLTGQAFYLNKIVNDAGMFPSRNYLPALLFILFSSLLPEWNYLSAALMSNWLLLLALKGLINLFDVSNMGKTFFNTGLLLSCIGLISFSYLVFVLLIFIAAGISRPFKLKEWLTGLLGIIVPYYFLYAILYLTNNFEYSSHWIPTKWQFISIDFLNDVKLTYSLIFLSVLLMVAVFFLYLQTQHMIMKIKKRWAIISVAFVLALVPLIFNHTIHLTAAFPLLIFLSLMASNIFLKENKAWWLDILFYALIVLVLLAEWLPV